MCGQYSCCHVRCMQSPEIVAIRRLLGLTTRGCCRTTVSQQAELHANACAVNDVAIKAPISVPPPDFVFSSSQPTVPMPQCHVPQMSCHHQNHWVAFQLVATASSGLFLAVVALVRKTKWLNNQIVDGEGGHTLHASETRRSSEDEERQEPRRAPAILARVKAEPQARLCVKRCCCKIRVSSVRPTI